ncbi:hypothetical protein [Alkalilacustris brevis]|uniref:hypothetical protein n=1 Tax=Alkalilacustris brevis TaxID=2026338 RepID=UPI000E0D4320|nr:hypothetical protein [Alkalilacustris brevis]
MTDGKDPKGNATGEALVAASEAALTATVAALHEVLGRVRQGEFGRIDDLIREQRELRRALVMAFEERHKVEKLRRNSGGGGDAPDAALDLAAARDEIGRRLACLRAAADPDRFSGKPE